MKKLLYKRLQELKHEYALGKDKLEQIESQYENLNSTLLRISGAIQVLEELLVQENGDSEDSFHNLASKPHDEEQPATADE